MKIDGRDVGLLYTLGADCDIDDEMQKIGVTDFAAMIERLGVVKAYAKIAAILNKWYCLKNGGEPISETEILCAPAGDITGLEGAVVKALTEGRKTSIQAEPKRKNVKSTAKSN